MSQVTPPRTPPGGFLGLIRAASRSPALADQLLRGTANVAGRYARAYRRFRARPPGQRFDISRPRRRPRTNRRSTPAGPMASNVVASNVSNPYGAKTVFKRKRRGSNAKRKKYKKFAKKVKKIVAADKPFGYHQTTQFQTLRQNTTNKWSHFGSTVAGQDYEFFMPAQFKDAEGICFNDKPASLNSYDSTTVGVNGNMDTNSKTYVADSHVDYKFVNTSQMPTFVEMYVCKSKKANRTGVAAGLPVVQHPIAMWSALKEQVDLHGDLSGVGYDVVADLNSCAAQAVLFNANFDYELVKLKLEPGQVVTHRLQGPKNYTFDASKKLVPGQTNGLTDPVFAGWGSPGTGTVVFFRVITELSLDNGGVPAHTQHAANTGIAMRWTTYYKMRGPNQDQQSKIDNAMSSLVIVTGVPSGVGQPTDRDEVM